MKRLNYPFNAQDITCSICTSAGGAATSQLAFPVSLSLSLIAVCLLPSSLHLPFTSRAAPDSPTTWHWPPFRSSNTRRPGISRNGHFVLVDSTKLQHIIGTCHKNYLADHCSPERLWQVYYYFFFFCSVACNNLSLYFFSIFLMFTLFLYYRYNHYYCYLFIWMLNRLISTFSGINYKLVILSTS